MVDAVARREPYAPAVHVLIGSRSLHPGGEKTPGFGGRAPAAASAASPSRPRCQPGTNSRPQCEPVHRHAQFKYIARQVKALSKTGDPVISVDTKKKELVGAF